MVFRDTTEDGTVRLTGNSGSLAGEIKMWPTATPPVGHLMCNGGTFQSTAYPALAALLGNTYGTSSGTTYYLPDFRARSPIGAGTLSPDQGNGYGYAPGSKNGQQRVTLSVAETPSHSHGGGTAAPSVPSGEAMYRAKPTAYYGGGGHGTNYPNAYYGDRVMVTDDGYPTSGHSHAITAQGGGGSHENSPPTLGINFIIKT